MLRVQNSNWRDHYNPLRGLTLARVLAMEDQADQGRMSDLQWLWRHMELTDVTVQSAMARRLSFVNSLEWDIRVVENADPGLGQAQSME